MQNSKDNRLSDSDHDLLIRIDERVKKLDRCMSNHLRHHWAITLAIVATFAAAFAALILK